MATKNQIAQTIWILKAIQIIPAKSYKQKRLEFAYRERVGINCIVVGQCDLFCKGH